MRSEFHEAMFGSRLVTAFEEVKDAFDPTGLFNPGKIVRPERMDDRELFRFKPGYAADWSVRDRAQTGRSAGGFGRAVEMCNNNGACRKFEPRRDVPVLPRHAWTSGTSPAGAPTRCGSR